MSPTFIRTAHDDERSSFAIVLGGGLTWGRAPAERVAPRAQGAVLRTAVCLIAQRGNGRRRGFRGCVAQLAVGTQRQTDAGAKKVKRGARRAQDERGPAARLRPAPRGHRPGNQRARSIPLRRPTGSRCVALPDTKCRQCKPPQRLAQRGQSCAGLPRRCSGFKS